MTTKKLKELLFLVNGINIRHLRWNMVMKIVDYINNEKVTVVKKEWADDYKQKNPDWYPLDLKDIGKWSTYEESVDIRFFIDGLNLKCECKIWDGSLLDGHKERLRFTVELILPNKFIKEIEGSINRKFESYLEDKYEAFLESEKKKWIDNKRTEILNM